MTEFADRLLARVEGDVRYRHTRNLVVVQGGDATLVRHFGSGSVEDPVDLFSVTKSVLATLVGIALDEGALASLDDLVRDYLGAEVRQAYTLRHLLTMTAGVETGGAWDIDAVMARPAGWVPWLLAAPARREPGSRFVYDNGAAHVLAAVLAAAVGRPISQLARERLFAPLGIERFEWPHDPDGVDYGFGHLRLAPRDLAKLGELYLAGGRWGGQRVVSREFVEEATRAQVEGGPPEGAVYGLLWWIGEEPVPHFFAAGYAGQSLTVIPERELVVVTTGDDAALERGWRNARHAVLEAL